MTDDELRARVAKLPAWAQTLIQNLERQRDSARERLNRFLDDQPESPFYTDESVHERPYRERRRFITATSVHCRQDNLVVTLNPFSDNRGVIVDFESDRGPLDCAIMPRTSNSIMIVDLDKRKPKEKTKS